MPRSHRAASSLLLSFLVFGAACGGETSEAEGVAEVGGASGAASGAGGAAAGAGGAASGAGAAGSGVGGATSAGGGVGGVVGGGAGASGSASHAGGSGTAGSGGTSGEDVAGAAGAGGEGGNAGGSAGSGGPADPPKPSPAACEAAVSSLAMATSGVSTCTALVRLDYQSLTPKSYRLACAPYAAVDEAAARKVAEKTFGFGHQADAVAIGGPSPADAHFFFRTPKDFGDIAIVDARSGAPLFGGTIVWLGTGEIVFPTAFSPSADLAIGCTSTTQLPSARSFDLRFANTPPLAPEVVDATLETVWNTALPDALWQKGYVFDAVVVLYPPRLGLFDPKVAEYLVMVNSGWLE